jgi:hypothetical protein
MPRPWVDIDWQALRPEWSDIRRSHRELSFRTLDIDHPAAAAVLDELRRTHDNGGALLKRFTLDSDDDVLHWFASRNRFGEYDFFQIFLGSQAVRDALPQLQVPEQLGRDLGFGESRQLGRDLGFAQSWSGTLTLDGELAAMLVAGGAYERFKGTPTEAKRLCAAFVDAIVGDRHGDFVVYETSRPWSPWFYDIAWDKTWALIDQRQDEVILLCVTDTD